MVRPLRRLDPWAAASGWPGDGRSAVSYRGSSRRRRGRASAHRLRTGRDDDKGVAVLAMEAAAGRER